LLNRRLTQDMYLGVVPVTKAGESWAVSTPDTAFTAYRVIADFAVCMRRMDPERRMDLLLAKSGVSVADVVHLADRLAQFHRQATIVPASQRPGMRELFDDLGAEASYLEQHCAGARATIENAIRTSTDFLDRNSRLMKDRQAAGCYRDGHGDLHTRNIFLLDRPQVFDCIEFNDDFRRIDVLNDIAFLCMDLDALGHTGLSELFFERWSMQTGKEFGKPDRQLFVYYKAYRANIRAKINSLRARSASSDTERLSAIKSAAGYLRLLEVYCHYLRPQNSVYTGEPVC